uniref:Uncharacterized protein n=1 Tax=Rhizophagus irregularis (strain DAOM 181602 / DAOM 197198 / MUCL 43194) TaxID=747089 RepID=U9TNH3_RHIID
MASTATNITSGDMKILLSLFNDKTFHILFEKMLQESSFGLLDDYSIDIKIIEEFKYQFRDRNRF